MSRARVVIVYHSGSGHTKVLAEHVAAGAAEVPGVEVACTSVADVDWSDLASADAIVFGCPTYMGGPSAPFKAFMDASSRQAWATRAWKDKLAAGFTNSSAMSGDKLATLVQLAVFAAQHDMVWVGLGLRPGNNTSRGSERDLNRLGSHLGAMAQSDADVGAEEAPPESDRRTAAHLGERVARAAVRWVTGERVGRADTGRHPTTAHWAFPPGERAPLPAPLRRVSLRELFARPGRFEHHLTVVARLGCAQLEVVTASEPLYFAHHNISDEYALGLSVGDPLMEALPFVTLLSDEATGEDVARIKFGVGTVTLHPVGLLHWPGRLRPPFEPLRFGPGERRTGLTLVYCASRPAPAHPERPLFLSEGHAGAAKTLVDQEVPFLLADTRREASRVLGRVGDTQMELLADPSEVKPEHGGYLVVLDGSGLHFGGDLIYLPPGALLPGDGLARALLFTRVDGPPEPPPPSWEQVADPPFDVYEDAPPGELPLTVEALHFEELDARTVRVRMGDGETDVPRYWLARMLFRIALHDYAVGYLETYGGFFYDDRGGNHRLGVRGLGEVTLGDRELQPVIEQLYRAVAPEGYVERLT